MEIITGIIVVLVAIAFITLLAREIPGMLFMGAWDFLFIFILLILVIVLGASALIIY